MDFRKERGIGIFIFFNSGGSYPWNRWISSHRHCYRYDLPIAFYFKLHFTSINEVNNIVRVFFFISKFLLHWCQKLNYVDQLICKPYLGATGGIGAETARVLALRGVHVVMAVRNTEICRKVKENILTETPDAKVDIMELDLSSQASVRDFATRYRSSGLPLHILM